MTEPKQPMAPTEAAHPASHVDDASEAPPELADPLEPAEVPVAAGTASVDPDDDTALVDDEADDEADDAGVAAGAMTDTTTARDGTVGRVQVRRRFGRTTQPAVAPTVSEVAVRIQDRASQVYVAVVVAVFAAILLNALFLGHGGLFAPTPSASLLPSAAAPSAGASAAAAPSAGASAAPSASASAAPSAGASATP